MKYLIIILFTLFCINNVNAQIYSNPNPTMYGIQYSRFKPVLVQHLPHLSDTSSIHTNDTTVQIAEYDGKIIFHLGTGYWQELAGTSNVFIDSANFKYIADSINVTDPLPFPEEGQVFILAHTGLTGEFIGHEDNVATYTGGTYVYQIPTENQQAIVNETENTSFWQFDGAIWRNVNYALNINGNNIGSQFDAGNSGNYNFSLITNNRRRITIRANGDMLFTKFKNIPSNNVLSITDTTNGKVGYVQLHQLYAQSPLSIDGDTIKCETCGEGSQDLQEVTDIGYLTTNPIISTQGFAAQATGADASITAGTLTDNVILLYDDATSQAFINFNRSGAGTTNELRADNADGAILQLPNASGNLALGVTDGITTEYANDTGVIDISGMIVSGSTPNALTMNNSGSGASSGTTFDGSLARTISYNTIGAVPTTRTLTINGTSHDLSTDQSWTITGGITVLNTLTASTQTFATGTSGSDFNISSSSTTHTFNIPDASASNRGLVTTGAQTFAGVKTLTNPVINVGSDATGDMYYRNSGGLFTRLPIGTDGQIFGVVGGLPSWSTLGVTDSLAHTIYARTNNTPTFKLILADTTTAINVTQQGAPGIKFTGKAYNGITGANLVDFGIYESNTQSNSGGSLHFGWSYNGSALSSIFHLNTSGVPEVPFVTSTAMAIGGAVSLVNSNNTAGYFTMTGSNLAGNYQTFSSNLGFKMDVQQNNNSVNFDAFVIQPSQVGGNGFRNRDLVIQRTQSTWTNLGSQRMIIGTTDGVEQFGVTNTGVATFFGRLGTQSINSVLTNTPSAPTLSASTSGGRINNGTYYYVVTGVDAFGGETTIGTVSSSVATTGSNLSSVTVTLPSKPQGIISFNIHRSTASTGFVPGTNTLIITGITGATYLDTARNVSTGSVPDVSTSYLTKFSNTTSADNWINNGGKLGIATNAPVYGLDVALRFGVDSLTGKVYQSGTVTGGGTTGDQTINKVSGTVNFAAAATSLVVTNSMVTSSSIVICQIMTNDATAKSTQVVPASGSFTIYLNAAATAETKVYFEVKEIR